MKVPGVEKTGVDVAERRAWLGGGLAAATSIASAVYAAPQPEGPIEFIVEHGGRHVGPGWFAGVAAGYAFSAGFESFGGQEAGRAVKWGRWAGRAAVFAYSVYGEASGKYPVFGPTGQDPVGDVIGAQIGAEIAVRAIVVEADASVALE